jgi:RNA polymerase sigma-70 factor (ECF subfamily)
MSYSDPRAALAAPLAITTSLDVRANSPASVDAEVLALFDRYERPLLRYAWSLGLNRTDAEDVVQDAFFALFQHLRLGRSRQNLPGWLFQVVRNLAGKRRRRNRRIDAWSASGVGAEPIGPDGDPEMLMVEAERRRRWRLVLRAMPDRDRRCLLLRAEGLRYRDIARVLGVSLGSVAKSITRGIAKLVSAEQL